MPQSRWRFWLGEAVSRPGPEGLTPWAQGPSCQYVSAGRHGRLEWGRAVWVVTAGCPQGHVHEQGHSGRTVAGGPPNDGVVCLWAEFSCQERRDFQKPVETSNIPGDRDGPEKSTGRPPLD